MHSRFALTPSLSPEAPEERAERHLLGVGRAHVDEEVLYRGSFVAKISWRALPDGASAISSYHGAPCDAAAPDVSPSPRGEGRGEGEAPNHFRGPNPSGSWIG